MIWESQLHAYIPNEVRIADTLIHEESTTSPVRRLLETVGIVSMALTFILIMVFIVSSTQTNIRIKARIEDTIHRLAWCFQVSVVARLLLATTANVGRNQKASLRTLLIDGWIALHRTRGWILALGLLHIGVVVAVWLHLMLGIHWSHQSIGAEDIFTIYGLSPQVKTVQQYVPSMVVLALLLTLLEVISTTAIGLVSGLIVGKRYAFLVALMVRAAPIVVAILAATRLDGWWFAYRHRTWAVFADGGIGTLIQMTYPINIWARSFDRGLLQIGALISLTVVILAVAICIMTLHYLEVRGEQTDISA
jgi:hypothetical protein